MRRPRWAQWVKEQREKVQINRRGLSKIVDIDPSYITLIERDGYVPKSDIVELIARALCPSDIIERDMGMIYAGYSPLSVSLSDMRRALIAIHDARAKLKLAKEQA